MSRPSTSSSWTAARARVIPRALKFSFGRDVTSLLWRRGGSREASCVESSRSLTESRVSQVSCALKAIGYTHKDSVIFVTGWPHKFLIRHIQFFDIVSRPPRDAEEYFSLFEQSAQGFLRHAGEKHARPKTDARAREKHAHTARENSRVLSLSLERSLREIICDSRARGGRGDVRISRESVPENGRHSHRRERTVTDASGTATDRTSATTPPPPTALPCSDQSASSSACEGPTPTTPSSTQTSPPPPSTSDTFQAPLERCTGKGPGPRAAPDFFSATGGAEQKPVKLLRKAGVHPGLVGTRPRAPGTFLVYMVLHSTGNVNLAT